MHLSKPLDYSLWCLCIGLGQINIIETVDSQMLITK